jgi:hypothetical protein
LRLCAALPQEVTNSTRIEALLSLPKSGYHGRQQEEPRCRFPRQVPEAEYDQAIQQLEELLDRNLNAGSEEHDLLEFLSALVEEYEAKHYPDEMFTKL